MANAMEFSGQCLSMLGGVFARTFYTFTVPLRCWGERHATALALKTALEVASTQQVAYAKPQQRERQRKLLQRCGYDMAARILEDGREDARMRKQRHLLLFAGGGALSLDWGLIVDRHFEEVEHRDIHVNRGLILKWQDYVLKAVYM